MNPDPVAKLAKFTPARGPDAAELLFAAGRASARTHWGWKAAVAALLVSNAALGAFVAFGQREAPAAPPAPTPVAQPQPELLPPVPPSSSEGERWSYQLLRKADLNQPPAPEPVADLSPTREPLTALAGRDGDLD